MWFFPLFFTNFRKFFNQFFKKWKKNYHIGRPAASAVVNSLGRTRSSRRTRPVLVVIWDIPFCSPGVVVLTLIWVWLWICRCGVCMYSFPFGTTIGLTLKNEKKMLWKTKYTNSSILQPAKHVLISEIFFTLVQISKKRCQIMARSTISLSA